MAETGVKSISAGRVGAGSFIPRDSIFIGSKPVMSYVTAVMMHFAGEASELTVKARGNAISRAVDVVEVCRRRFFGDRLTVSGITIGTDVLGEGAEARNVSTIEIKIKRTG
ncbi:MAG: DNA/RNA-binding protein AlbA [Candidatus Bathyarchaeia archaeon]